MNHESSQLRGKGGYCDNLPCTDSVNSTAARPGLAMGTHSRLASVDQALLVPQQLVGYNLKIKQI